MRALTVRQPWAWAIVHGGKDVENRSRNLAGSYRGPVAIHAGLTHEKDTQAGQVHREAHGTEVPTELVFGAVIGVVDLFSVHHDSDHGRGYACSSWAIAGDWHLMLANPRPLADPIPAKGRLGLWTPDEQLQAGIWEQVNR